MKCGVSFNDLVCGFEKNHEGRHQDRPGVDCVAWSTLDAVNAAIKSVTDLAVRLADENEHLRGTLRLLDRQLSQKTPQQFCGAHLEDLTVAGNLRMLGRNDLHFEPTLVTARDRLMHLMNVRTVALAVVRKELQK